MENQTHEVLGGKAYVFRRIDSQFWQCAAYIKGYNYRSSTRECHLHHAIKYAEDWYFRLRGLDSVGQLNPTQETTFREVAEQFMKEYSVITEGQRSPRWVQGHDSRLRVHLLPFFGDTPISDVTVSKVQEYRIHRMTRPQEKNPHAKDNRPFKDKTPASKTLHNEIVTLRQVLKTAVRHGWLTAVPDLSAPFRGSGKVSHRPWFSPAEYKQLYEATRKNAKEARVQDKWAAEQLHDYVLFMGNTGLRPDEAKNLQHRDIEIVDDKATGEKILVIEVRGKRGVGYCKSTAGAVRPYQRLLKRAKPSGNDVAETSYPQPMDVVFPGSTSKCLKASLFGKSSSMTGTEKREHHTVSDTHISVCVFWKEQTSIRLPRTVEPALK